MGCFSRLCTCWPFDIDDLLVRIAMIDLSSMDKLCFPFRYVANRYLIANPKSNIDVEWAYCFDVHLNAVLPLLTILHVVQLPFLNCK